MNQFKKILLLSIVCLPINIFAAITPAEQFEKEKNDFTIKVTSAQPQRFSITYFVDHKMVHIEDRTPFKVKLHAQVVRLIVGTDEALPPITTTLEQTGSRGITSVGHSSYDCLASKFAEKKIVYGVAHSLCDFIG